MGIVIRLVSLGIGYCFGCIQTAYIVTKLMRNKDIRTLGSGNPGAANVTQMVGKLGGAITLFADFAKTLAAIGVSYLLFRDKLEAINHTTHLLTAYAGFGTVLGHTFPFWLHFRGGKGVAVTLAMLVVLDWKALVIVVLAAVVVYLAGRRLLMCTMTLAMVTPFVLWAHRYPWEVIAVVGVISVLIIWAHRGELRSAETVLAQMRETVDMPDLPADLDGE